MGLLSLRRRWGLGLVVLAVTSCAQERPPSSPSGHERSGADATSSGAESPPPENEASTPEAVGEADLEARYGGRTALASYRGEASYYGAAFEGRRTASGEVFRSAGFTAAHRTLPFGTIVRVARVDSSKQVYVRINDRGPFGSRHRIIDVSRAAAQALDMVRRGVAEVRVEVVELGPRQRSRRRR